MTTAGEASPPVKPSQWIVAHAGLIAARGTVLDVAAGNGRHAKYFNDLGYRVTAIDRAAEALRPLSAAGIETIVADLEDGSPWPLAARRFDGIVVTNYLHRPLFPHIAAALAAGGILIYETFGAGNERFGRPSNPNFLLRPGELLEFARDHGLQVLAYACGEVSEHKPAITQRIVAQRL